MPERPLTRRKLEAVSKTQIQPPMNADISGATILSAGDFICVYRRLSAANV
jgi:hypothetical protein